LLRFPILRQQWENSIEEYGSCRRSENLRLGCGENIDFEKNINSI